MLVSGFLRRGAVVVKPGCSHAGLEFADGGFRLGDPPLEAIDLALAHLRRLHLLALFGVEALAFIARR